MQHYYYSCRMMDEASRDQRLFCFSLLKQQFFSSISSIKGVTLVLFLTFLNDLFGSAVPHHCYEAMHMLLFSFRQTILITCSFFPASRYRPRMRDLHCPACAFLPPSYQSARRERCFRTSTSTTGTLARVGTLLLPLAESALCLCEPRPRLCPKLQSADSFPLVEEPRPCVASNTRAVLEHPHLSIPQGRSATHVRCLQDGHFEVQDVGRDLRTFQLTKRNNSHSNGIHEWYRTQFYLGSTQSALLSIVYKA